LDPRLQRVLDAELARGNEVSTTSEWLYQHVEILICFRRPIRDFDGRLDDGLKVEEFRDHWVSAEPLVDLFCEVPSRAGAGPGQACWHVLRSPKSA
jgi:hypothetical protein